ncbi:MAG TPA: hypothetical protein DCZ75_09780 [Geobacter sp.]|nr:hypothetical protein [Geobacter sp.]
MNWDPMTADEYALSQQSEGLKVKKVDGVWWVEARPFFFRPLFPFAEIPPTVKKYPFKAIIGGVLHVVPSGAPSNSSMNFFIYDQLSSYSLESLTKTRRKRTRKAINDFIAKDITDLGQFAETAYEVYMSFWMRTKYPYNKERVNKDLFAEWAKALYSHPKILKTGAYYDGKLAAVEISYRVDDVIVSDTSFATDLGLELEVTDFVLHVLREAAARTNAKYLFLGLPSGVESLDESKLQRGCKVLKMPACYRINPVALLAAKVFMRPSYDKLMKIVDPVLEEKRAEAVVDLLQNQ